MHAVTACIGIGAFQASIADESLYQGHQERLPVLILELDEFGVEILLAAQRRTRDDDAVLDLHQRNDNLEKYTRVHECTLIHP